MTIFFVVKEKDINDNFEQEYYKFSKLMNNEEHIEEFKIEEKEFCKKMKKIMRMITKVKIMIFPRLKMKVNQIVKLLKLMIDKKKEKKKLKKK